MEWEGRQRERLQAMVSEGCLSLPRVSGGTCACWAPTRRFPPSPRTIMSAVPSTSTSRSNFVSVFNAALETYKRKTKNDLASHPLLPAFQSCDSPEAVLTVLREQIPGFNESRDGDDGLTKWVTPTVNVLYSFSSTIGGGVGLVSIRLFPRVKSFGSNVCFFRYYLRRT